MNVCVVGTSYIGAVYKAYQNLDAAARPATFHFFASVGEAFRDLHGADGRLEGYRFASPGASGCLTDYDCFFIYGDLFTPHRCFRLAQAFEDDGHSRQASRAAVVDTISRCHSVKLSRQFAAVGDAPVFIMSMNVAATAKPLADPAHYDDGVALLRVALAERYFEFPRPLFDASFLPQALYTKNSLIVTGGRPDVSRFPEHDAHHLNAEGGKLILEAWTEAARRRA